MLHDPPKKPAGFDEIKLDGLGGQRKYFIWPFIWVSCWSDSEGWKEACCWSTDVRKRRLSSITDWLLNRARSVWQTPITKMLKLLWNMSFTKALLSQRIPLLSLLLFLFRASSTTNYTEMILAWKQSWWKTLPPTNVKLFLLLQNRRFLKNLEICWRSNRWNSGRICPWWTNVTLLKPGKFFQI